jgi:hypothetical protein
VNDNKALFSVQRTTRLGDRRLGILDVTLDLILEEAGIGRALFIGKRTDETLISRVAQLICDFRSIPTVVAAWSYEACEDVADELKSQKVGFWSASRNAKSAPPHQTRSIMVMVPEKLRLIEKYILSGVFKPDIIHVLDYHKLLIRKPLWGNGGSRTRMSYIGRFKALCQAHGKIPYVIVWSTEGCKCCPSEHLHNALGVEALLWGDGLTVRRKT